MKGIPDGFWAKLDGIQQENQTTEWHPLIHHSADVSAVFQTLLRHTIFRKRLSTILQWEHLSDVHIQRLAALACLHDAGKVNHGFQRKVLPESGPTGGHVQAIIDVVGALDSSSEAQSILVDPLDLYSIFEWFEDEEAMYFLLLATFGHHGRPVKAGSNFRPGIWTPDKKRDPIAELSRLREYMEQWFPRAFQEQAQPFPNHPEFQHAYNGLLILSDWIGSDRAFFEFAESSESPTKLPRETAQKACADLGLMTDSHRKQLGVKPPDFQSFADFETPFQIQKKCLELPVQSDGSICILESETGSGKTEAALARFFRLFHAGQVDGMYFALPTRSAAKQLHTRVWEATKRAFPDESKRPPVVQAVPGYIKIDEQEAVKRLPDFSVLWDDDPEDRRRRRRWAAEHSKRYMVGTIAVGTIDQVFLSSLKVGHAHLRGSALLRHLLVVDEVHASDSYMTRLLESVLDHHLSAGGHAFLMSATLGSASRYRVMDEGNNVPSVDEAKKKGFPLITYSDSSRTTSEEIDVSSSYREKSVEIQEQSIASDFESLAEYALEAARSGARVLVIRNVTEDCRDTQKALEAKANSGDVLFAVNYVPAPHHSRFSPDDRRLLDNQIESAFGKDASRKEEKGLVCVATQTVEQSLDIDADLLISDLCPVDVLLQRIGRLHRHADTSRPDGYRTARTTVLTPEKRDLTEWIEQGGLAYGPHGYGTVYEDLRAIESTWRIIKNTQNWEIPQMNRKLVEQGTHPEVLQEIATSKGDDWENHQQKILGRRYANRWKGDKWMLDRSSPFGMEGFPRASELEERIRTRLGQDDHQVRIPESPEGPFGQPVEEINISGWMIEENESDQEEISLIERLENGFSFKYSGELFQYNQYGLIKITED